MRLLHILLSITLGCVVVQTGTAATCPPLVGTAVCNQGKWRVNVTHINNNWSVMHRLDDLSGNECSNEGEILKALNWGFAWSMYPGWGMMCRYYFSEKSHDFHTSDITLYSNLYQVDTTNNNWNFDYNWRWQCSKSQMECTLL